MTDFALWELPKAGGKIVRAKVTSYKGSAPYLDIREWYVDAGGEQKPGKGCTIPLSGIPAIHKALGDWLAVNEGTDG